MASVGNKDDSHVTMPTAAEGNRVTLPRYRFA